jgi:hypothetical protein
VSFTLFRYDLLAVATPDINIPASRLQARTNVFDFITVLLLLY